MASNQTTNYKLNQWQAEDKVLRTDFNADNLKVENALTGLAGQVAGKAAQSALDALSATVNGKAAQADLTALTATVNGKAAQSEVNTLKTQVAAKAEQSALTAGLAKKFGTDNPGWKVGSYVGTYTGSGTPTAVTVNLGFKPSFLILYGSGGSGSMAYRALIGTPAGMMQLYSDGTTYIISDGLTFTSTGFTVDKQPNLDTGFNTRGVTYYYLALK